MNKLSTPILWIINSCGIIAIICLAFVLGYTPNTPTFNRQLLNVAVLLIMMLIVAIIAILNFEKDEKK